MLEHCIACSRGRHDACDGIDYVIDQDGHSRYMCGCSCNRKTVTRPCPTCRGSGEVTETSYTKNRGRAVKSHDSGCLVYDTNGGICSCGASKDHWDCDPPCELHRKGDETS